MSAIVKYDFKKQNNKNDKNKQTNNYIFQKKII